jgi:hypothetical protein
VEEDAAAAEALAADDAQGGTGAGVAATPLVDFEDLGPSAGKSRALSDGLWGRAFMAAYNSSTAEERQRMVEGLGKGVGLALLAVPMVEAFTFTQAQLRRILRDPYQAFGSDGRCEPALDSPLR